MASWPEASALGWALALLALGPSALVGQAPVGATALATCDEVIAIGGHGGVDLWTLGERTTLGDTPRNVFALTFAGERLIEAGGAAARHAAVRAWDWRARRLLWEEIGGTDLLYSVAVVADRVWVGGADSKIALLDLASGALVEVLEGHTGAVLALAASPDGHTLVSAGVDRSLRVWDTATKELVRAIHNHGDTVHALSWSPDGRYLASGSSDRTVRVFQPRIGRLVRIVRGHDATVLSLSFEQDVILAGASDGRIRVIEAQTDRILDVFDQHDGWVVGLGHTRAGRVSLDDQGKAWIRGSSGVHALATKEPATPGDGEAAGPSKELR